MNYELMKQKNDLKTLNRHQYLSPLRSFTIITLTAAAPRRRATSHLEQPPEKLDNEAVGSAKSTSDVNLKGAPLRKSQSGVATVGRLRVMTTSPPQGGGSVVDSPATPDQERPRRRQPSAARSRPGTRDQSLTQFAVMDDENVSQQVRRYFNEMVHRFGLFC